MEGKYAGTVTVGAKGQIVIPKEVRDMFGIRPGDVLLLLADQDHGIAMPPKKMFRDITEQVFGGGPKHE